MFVSNHLKEVYLHGYVLNFFFVLRGGLYEISLHNVIYVYQMDVK